MFGLLIDVSAKQDYIFSSSKLKDNIGASNILAHKVFNFKFGKDPQKPDSYEKNYESNRLFAGGGNALLQFDDTTQRKNFITEYSSHILKNFPGVKLNFGLCDNLSEDSEWANNLSKKFHLSTLENRNQHHVLYKPFKPGIASDCKFSGSFISGEMDRDEMSTENMAKRDEKDFIIKSYENSDNEDYKQIKQRLSVSIDDIVNEKQDAYVAVVHIDVNGMGDLFKQQKKLSDLITLSDKVNRTLDEALLHFLSDVEKSFSENKVDFGNFEVELKDDILPIRPIINAGDDITFVCHGKLGIYLAETYIKIITEKLNQDISSNSRITCSAGVAIVNKKFPFSRAYQLSTELTTEAKNRHNKAKDIMQANWINFMILPNSYTGDFSNTIANNYRKPNLRGAYYILPDGETKPENLHKEMFSFEEVKNELNRMVYDSNEKWSKNKVMHLRNLLGAEESTIELFLQHMKVSKKYLKGEETQLPNFPYEDLINMIDFYPQNKLNS